LHNNLFCIVLWLKIIMIKLHNKSIHFEITSAIGLFPLREQNPRSARNWCFYFRPLHRYPEETEKEQPLNVHGVHFEYIPVLKPDPSLVEFIHKYTGKMKPLAESDLDSYLRLGIQLLNIGKPFYFEGIGSIIKNKEDRYDFEPGEFSTAKLSLPGEAKTDSSDKRKKTFDEPQTEYSPQSKAAKKILLVIGIIGGIALIAWGGYNLYKNKATTKGENENGSLVNREDTLQQVSHDTVSPAAAQTDSFLAKKKDSSILISKRSDSSLYKFVILTTQSKTMR